MNTQPTITARSLPWVLNIDEPLLSIKISTWEFCTDILMSYCMILPLLLYNNRQYTVSKPVFNDQLSSMMT